MTLNTQHTKFSQSLLRIQNKLIIWFCYFYARWSNELFVSQKIFFFPARRSLQSLNYHKSFVEDHQKLLDTPASLVLEPKCGLSSSFYNYQPSTIEYAYNTIKLFKGSPLAETKTFQDVWYLPQYRCFYQQDGSRIDYSCQPEYKIAPKTISIPKNFRKVNQKLIYGGHLFRHYGHFITECICRLWYAAKEQNYSIIYSESPRFSIKRDYIDIFMNAIGFDKERFVAFDEPILLKEVIIPYPSFMMNYHAYTVHRLLPEAIAQAILKEPLKKIAQPLYLSRKKLKKNKSFRSILNEEKLEDRIREKNFKIVYPEQLSFAEQIQLINQHETIVGVSGSALHTVLFDLSDNHLICLSDLDYIHPNLLLVDGVKSKNSSYIAAVEVEQDESQERIRKNRILDIETTISGLKTIGLF